MESLQHIYQDLWEMDPVSYSVSVIRQAKHVQLSSTYAHKKKKFSQFHFFQGKQCTQEETYHPKAGIYVRADWCEEPTFCS